MTKTIQFAFAALISIFAINAQAQTQKIGHINSDELLAMMPEAQAAQTSLEDYRAQLEKDMREMEAELETKIAAFQQNQQIMTNLSRETKTREIQDLQARIQEFGQSAQQDLQAKQVELISPIIDKATNAVKEVAKENNFTYIMDSAPSKATVIFFDNGEDILPLVKAKLGIQ